MVKIGICDDEPEMRKPLRQILEQVLQLQGVEYLISESESGEDLTAGISCLDIDILFLDIEMRSLDGIDSQTAAQKGDERHYHIRNRLPGFCLPRL
ncbi:MAG: response regulator [Blautia sp.]